MPPHTQRMNLLQITLLKLFYLISALSLLLGCASSAVIRSDISHAQVMGVDDEVIQKIKGNEPLNENDLRELWKKGVEIDSILRFMQSCKTSRSITPQILDQLKQEGLPEPIIRQITAVPISSSSSDRLPVTDDLGYKGFGNRTYDSLQMR